MSRPWLVCSRRWMSVHSSQPRPMTGQWDEFLLENIVKIFAFLSFTNTGQVVEILPAGREGLTYSTLTVPWVLISWRWWSQGISSHGIDGVHVLVYTSFNTTLLALGGVAKILIVSLYHKTWLLLGVFSVKLPCSECQKNLIVDKSTLVQVYPCTAHNSIWSLQVPWWTYPRTICVTHPSEPQSAV